MGMDEKCLCTNSDCQPFSSMGWSKVFSRFSLLRRSAIFVFICSWSRTRTWLVLDGDLWPVNEARPAQMKAWARENIQHIPRRHARDLHVISRPPNCSSYFWHALLLCSCTSIKISPNVEFSFGIISFFSATLDTLYFSVFFAFVLDSVCFFLIVRHFQLHFFITRWSCFMCARWLLTIWPDLPSN